MASTYTAALRLELQANTENSSTWGTKANAVFSMIEQAVAGYLAKSVAGGVDVTLTTANSATDEARNAILNFTGLLTANINVIVPTFNKIYLVKNSTTGSFTLTVKTSAGTGVAVPQGSVRWLFCDGTNVLTADTTNIATPVAIGSGGSGATTAAGARTAFGSTTVGDALFIAASAAVARAALGSTTIGDALFIAASAAAARITLGLIIGTDVQAYDGTLAALAGVTVAADKMIYATGADAFSTTTVTSFIRTLLDDTDAATARATLGATAGLSAATQAEMEAASSTSVASTPGRAQYHPGVAKAWVKFTGSSGSTTASHNSSGVSRSSEGVYVWTIGTDFSSANYAVVVGVFNAGSFEPHSIEVSAQSAGSITVKAFENDGSPYDPPSVYIVAFGDQA